MDQTTPRLAQIVSVLFLVPVTYHAIVNNFELTNYVVRVKLYKHGG